MKPGDIREKSEHELAKLSHDLEGEFFTLRFKKGAGQLKQTSSLSKTRRDLARVRTVIRERELLKGKGRKA